MWHEILFDQDGRNPSLGQSGGTRGGGGGGGDGGHSVWIHEEDIPALIILLQGLQGGGQGGGAGGGQGAATPRTAPPSPSRPAARR